MKPFLFLFFSLICSAGQAQAEARTFGFFGGFQTQLLSLGATARQRPDLPRIQFQRTGMGGTIGIYGRWPLLNGVALQPEFGFSFLRQRAQLWADGRIVDQPQYTFADLEIPLHIVLTNPVGRLPLRSNVLFGGQLGLNLSATSPEGSLGLARERLAIDLGLGVDFNWGNWQIQPQVLYSHGLNNIHEDTGTLYDLAIDRVLRDKISLRVLVLMMNDE